MSSPTDTTNDYREVPRSFTARLGKSALDALAYSRTIATYCGYSAFRLGPGIFGMRRVSFDVLVRQTLFTGVEALPFTAFIGFLVGTSLTLTASLGLGAAEGGPLARILAIGLFRELAPLITGLIIVGRSGTAVVVELGNMKVSGEVDTLQAMGIDVFEYLVVPRMGAFALSTFCNTVLFCAVALLAAVVGNLIMLENVATGGDLAFMVVQALHPMDLVLLTVKTLPVGLIVAAIVCHEGMCAGPDITDVPRATTRGTVTAFTTLFVSGGALSALFLVV